MTNGTTPFAVTDPRSLTLHEVTELFPSLSDEQMRDLEASIDKNQLTHPIVVWRDRIIDGRHRWIAALNVGYEFRHGDFVAWDGREDDLVDYVYELNAKCRRQMTPSQLDALGVALMEARLRLNEARKAERCRTARMEGGGRNTTTSPSVRAAEEAAAIVGRSEKQIRDAAKVKEESPELFEEIKRGETTVGAAKRKLGLGLVKPKGRCRINGVEQDDTPEVAKHRRNAKIPADVIIDVEMPDESTSTDAIREEYEERAAIKDDVSDKDWLAALPLSSVLKDQQLAVFQDDALLYRAMEKHVKSLSHHASRTIGKSKRNGEYKWRLRTFLKVEPPERWNRCPEPFDGGCGGVGRIEVGLGTHECPRCHGRGYWVL